MIRLTTVFAVAVSVFPAAVSIASAGGGPAGTDRRLVAAEETAAQAEAASAKMPLPLKVVGTKVLNSRGEPVILRGVNCASLEWTSNAEGHIVESVKVAIRDWKVNHIRLPLSQDRWFGKAPEQKDEGAAYRALVKQIVDLCASKGVYIILDLHWSNAGEWGRNIGQHSMPDVHSVTFWEDCAKAYKNHPAVIFDLYNEPHDVSWDVWLQGGEIKDRPNTRRAGPPRTFEAVGMQKLLDTVRGTGARNVVIVGGLDWSYDFSGILEGRQLSDTDGNGVIYANHAYNNKGDRVETWIAKVEKATAKLPIIVSEFGGGAMGFGGFGRRRGARGGTEDPWLLAVMKALEDHQWAWTAWDFHPRAGPTLISDWNYTPTPRFGVHVKEALQRSAARTTPPRQ